MLLEWRHDFFFFSTPHLWLPPGSLTVNPPPLNPHTSSLCRFQHPPLSSTTRHLFLVAPPRLAFNLTLHFPPAVSLPPLLPVCSRGEEEGERKKERAVWNPLSSWGISVSLWEPYWLPSFIIIPPPLPPSGSCTNHAFSFTRFFLPFLPSLPLYIAFFFVCVGGFIPQFVCILLSFIIFFYFTLYLPHTLT